MATQANKYKIEVALPVDSPFSTARVNTFVDNLNALPHNTGTHNGSPYNFDEPNVSLLHTVKEVTDIQLPSISKDNYEVTTIGTESILVNDTNGNAPTDAGYVKTYGTDSVVGNRKYQGSLVDGGEFSFTTESYIEPIAPLFGTGAESYISSLHGKDYTVDYPFQGIDINGNPFSQGYGGGNETFFFADTGWLTDTGSGLDIHSQNVDPTTKRYWEITPDGSTVSGQADTSHPVVMRQAVDSVYKPSMANKIYTIGYTNFLTADPTPYTMFVSKTGGDFSNVIANLPLTHQVQQTVTLRMQQAPVSFTFTASGSFGSLQLNDIYMLRLYTWEDMLLENTKVFFKVSEENTQRMLFESIITNVEINAPIDGKITKTITAKLTGGITHG